MYFLPLTILLANITLIASNVICSQSKVYSNILKELTKDVTLNNEDILEIQFSPLSSVNGITFNAILLINENDSYLQENVQKLDFQLTYSDNRTQIVQNCHYDIPTDGSVLRALQFENLKLFTKYAITVGYTLKSGESFVDKANSTFETCFGTPEAPTNLMISSQSDCAVVIQWNAPLVINAPKVCYYVVNMRPSGSSQVNENVELTSYSQILQPNTAYNFSIQAVNNGSCYSSENSKCLTLSSGSQSAFISYTCSVTTQPPQSTTSAAFTLNLNLILLFVLFLLNIINQF
jgi:hypothetical protein